MDPLFLVLHIRIVAVSTLNDVVDFFDFLNESFLRKYRCNLVIGDRLARMDIMRLSFKRSLSLPSFLLVI